MSLFVQLITSSYYNTDPYTMNTQPCSRTGSRLSGPCRNPRRFLLTSHPRSLTSASSSSSGFQSEVHEHCPVVPRNNFFLPIRSLRAKNCTKNVIHFTKPVYLEQRYNTLLYCQLLLMASHVVIILEQLCVISATLHEDGQTDSDVR